MADGIHRKSIFILKKSGITASIRDIKCLYPYVGDITVCGHPVIDVLLSHLPDRDGTGMVHVNLEVPELFKE